MGCLILVELKLRLAIDDGFCEVIKRSERENWWGFLKGC